MSGNEKVVAVPAPLYEKLSEMVGQSGADSVDELAIRIIRDWVSKQGSPGPKEKTSHAPPEDEKVIEERLKSLGYL